MKYFKKIVLASTLSLLLVSIGCTESDSRFGDNPKTGWVEFDGIGTTVNPDFSTLAVPIEINVPIFQNGIEIGYELEAVSGDYTQFVNASGSSVFESPEDSDRLAFVELELNNLSGLSEQVVFDVIITSTSIDNVSIGIDENSPTTYRVTIPCTNPDTLPSDYFVGEYTIADVEATIGPGNGTSNFEGGTITLSVDPLNPNTRLFDSNALPAFTAETPFFSFSLLFSTNNTVTLENFVGLGISCDSVSEYGFGPTDSATSWDICNDDSITITYEEDPNGSCGGPFVSSFSLVKN